MPRQSTMEARAERLPRLDPYVTDAVLDYWTTRYRSNRPPSIAAKVLTLIIELEREGRPFPNRHAVAAALDCSVFGVDAVVAAALARGEIEMEVRVEPGEIQSRDGVVKHRVFHPGEGLIHAARAGKRRVA